MQKLRARETGLPLTGSVESNITNTDKLVVNICNVTTIDSVECQQAGNAAHLPPDMVLHANHRDLREPDTPR